MAAGDLSSGRSACANQTATLLPNSSNSDKISLKYIRICEAVGWGNIMLGCKTRK
jgi:hypothetical protein